jgi:hypothetical protein
MAASFFSPVRLVGAVGSDCPFDLAEVFAGRDVDLAGLEVRENSKTFRWAGTYHEDINKRTTDKLELNVLAEGPPGVPDEFRDSEFVFCWIEGEPDDLKELLKRVDCLIINEDEARMLAGKSNLIKAGEEILAMGPGVAVIKKGESGSLVCKGSGERFILPAYPAAEVKDPTGAGDSFAGGFMGYLAKVGKTDFESLRKAVAYGTVVASYTISDFSLQGLSSIEKSDIDKRLEVMREVTEF